ncbi:tribbles homolog 2-like isoform X2 [Diprion similis]|uniref:tribbles homolog 2-like isoform X2 n=1 Tax=Diprion similis TaxID=362088 RepID=UPI001EF94A4D|nr:tribbles homolog 2-like isoform X2 [Diprion similis]
MRVARQHPLHLQVTRTNNGKFLVNSNGSQHDVGGQQRRQHQHLQQQQLLQQQQQQQQQQRQQQQQHQQRGNGDQQQLQQKTTNEETTNGNVSTAAFPSCESVPTPNHGPTLLGERFLLVGPAEGSALYRCIDVKTGQQLVAKALTVGDKGGQALLEAHLRLDGTGAASGVAGVVDAPGGRRYLLLEGHHGDLHAYVRARRRLREPEARRLFRQAAKAVSTCHENGVVLRDLKLRKFVFADETRTKLRLESLEDAVIVEDDNDKLADRRGCPAYVAPEVLRSGRAYSGKAADIWSLGVLLYTMLVGRYPFNDAEHASLFAKISRGQFAVPEGLSPRARCLVKALLRKEPSERPHGEDVVRHPWLSRPLNYPQPAARSPHDQLVPQSATNYSQD